MVWLTMTTPSRQIAWVAGGVAVFAASAGIVSRWASRPRPPTRYDTVPAVLARVGDVEIRKEQFKATLATDEVDQPSGDEANDEFYADLTWITARNAVMTRVLLPEVRRRGITLSDDERGRLEMSREQHYMLEVLARLGGATGADLLRQSEEALLIDKMLQLELEKEPVTEAEVAAEYSADPSSWTLPSGYRVARILLRSGSGERDADLRQRAAALADELRRDPRRFADAARRHSAADDAAHGGLLPEFTMNFPPFRDEDFLATIGALSVGQVSAPFRSGEGWMILKLEGRTPPRLMPIEQTRPRIVARLQLRKGRDRVRAWVDEQLERAGAEILVPAPNAEAR